MYEAYNILVLLQICVPDDHTISYTHKIHPEMIFIINQLTGYLPVKVTI